MPKPPAEMKRDIPRNGRERKKRREKRSLSFFSLRTSIFSSLLFAVRVRCERVSRSRRGNKRRFERVDVDVVNAKKSRKELFSSLLCLLRLKGLFQSYLYLTAHSRERELRFCVALLFRRDLYVWCVQDDAFDERFLLITAVGVRHVRTHTE